MDDPYLGTLHSSYWLLACFPALLAFAVIMLPMSTSFLWITYQLWKGWPRAARLTVVMLASLASMLLALPVAVLAYNTDFPLPPTEFSEDYTLLDFRMVSLGDTRERVDYLVGNPLESHIHDNIEYLWYSRPKGQSDNKYINRDFWVRIVCIDLVTDKVVCVYESFKFV